MPTENNAFAFTHSRLEAINPPKTGRDSYRDTKVAGLTFVITANASKSFYFYKRINGKPTRLRIGSYPDTSIDDARKEAQKFTGEIVKGGNPHQAKRTKNNAVTLEDLFNYWLDSYAKVHKKTWQEDVRGFRNTAVPSRTNN